MRLVQQLDEITFLAEHVGRFITVWEFENDFALFLHLQENKLREENELRRHQQKD